MISSILFSSFLFFFELDPTEELKELCKPYGGDYHYWYNSYGHYYTVGCLNGQEINWINLEAMRKDHEEN